MMNRVLNYLAVYFENQEGGVCSSILTRKGVYRGPAW